MSLFIVDTPEDIIGNIKSLIKKESEALTQKPDSPAKEETKGRIEKYAAFVSFLEAPDASKVVEVLPMSTEGKGSSSNFLILQAFQIGGIEKRLEDAPKKKLLLDNLYPDDSSRSNLAHFVLKAKENYFEWWEDGNTASEAILKGVVRINK